MPERSPLLVAEPALAHGRIPRRCADAVPMRRGQTLGRALHPLLGREHRARREALAAAVILAEPHDLGRGLHLRQHTRELLGTVRVPVDQPRQVLPRERRILVRERVERQVRIGLDALAVALRNRAMLGRTLGYLAPLLPARAGRPDLVLRLELDRLILERAVVDARLMPQLRQALVRLRGPRLAPALELGDAVPRPHLAPEPVGTGLAHRQHHVRADTPRPVRRRRCERERQRSEEIKAERDRWAAQAERLGGER